MSTPDARLDRAITAAKQLRLDDALVRQRAEELVRWSARGQSAGRPWWATWVPAVVLAGAAATIAIIVLRPRDPLPPDDAVVQIGARVALAATPGTQYTVVRSTDDQTEIAVASGAVTARLYPGATPHRLRLTSGSLEATATGTIYSLIVPATGAPYAMVHEGKVQLRDAQGERVLAAGETWPVAGTRVADAGRSATRLRQYALAAPPVEVAHPPDAGLRWLADRIDDAAVATDAAPFIAVPSAAERWQRARQLRGQGHTREAMKLLDELIARDDPTWSPLALVESIRIHASVSADPDAVVRLSKRFIERYPGHALVREVTEMLCRAHRDRGDTELPSACLLK